MAITWNPRTMATGVADIDAQHQELIRRFNAFHEAVKNRQGKEALEQTLAFLTAYSVTHFAHEESCMARLRCPAAQANRAAHDELRAEVARIRDRIASDGIQSLDVVELERFLGEWLRNHICTIDVKLRECVGAKS